jgi:hypothetical protein
MQIETNEFRRTESSWCNWGAPESPANTNEQGNQCHRGNNKNRRANRETKLEGKCSELNKGSVYDVVSGKDSFAKTTREIAKCVGHEFNNAGEFRTGMVELQLSPLVKLAPPTNVDQVVKFELWKMAWRTYKKQLEARHCNSARVWTVLTSPMQLYGGQQPAEHDQRSLQCDWTSGKRNYCNWYSGKWFILHCF